MKPSHGAALALAAAALIPAAAKAQSADDWKFSAAIYGYFPTIGGSSKYPPQSGGSSASVDIDTILDNLKFTFMGSIEASNGRWGGFADVIYMDIGNTKYANDSFTIGGAGIPADVNASVGFDLKGWVSTAAGTWRLVADDTTQLDALGGVRVLNLRPKLNWSLGGNVGRFPLADRAGTREEDERNIDAIIGLKGRTRFGASGEWFIPYYADIGTGQSKFTWQAYAGVGYSFGWGDLLAAWRYIRYDMDSDATLQDLYFNGPGVAVVFHW